MHIAIITAGGAGMYCGSCMHDNTWARALIQAGQQVTLVPTYTPIRVDEPDASLSRVFLGGLNVYLQGRYGWWRKLPDFLTRWVDRPAIIRLATRFAVSNDAKMLGDLTLGLLAGNAGPHRSHIAELAQFLRDDIRPDVIVFSNSLLAGLLPELQRQLAVPVFCLLQGDDIFLNGLIPPYQEQVLEQIRNLASGFDGFLLHTRYYRDYMSGLLQLPLERCHVLPLSIDASLSSFTKSPSQTPAQRPYTIGYFARICPEKGLHQLVQAFRLVQQQIPDARLIAGGFLGPRDKDYFRTLQRETESLGEAFEYIGSPDHTGKLEFFQAIDVLSVPTIYQEPKGIYILEAWAQGVPVAQPAHGSFPELLEQVPAGLLHTPGNIAELAEHLIRLGQDPALRLQLGRIGQQTVATVHDHAVLAQASVTLLQQLAQPHRQ